MPATEQTWRNSKLLHLVFGITSLAMLVTTLWMLAADHLREWKDVQRKFRDIETWTLQSRLDEQKTKGFEVETQRLENKLADLRRRCPRAAWWTSSMPWLARPWNRAAASRAPAPT